MLNIIFFEIQIAIIFSLGKGKEKNRLQTHQHYVR